MIICSNEVANFMAAERRIMQCETAEQYAQGWHELSRYTSGPRTITTLLPAGAGMYLLLRMLDWLRGAVLVPS